MKIVYLGSSPPATTHFFRPLFDTKRVLTAYSCRILRMTKPLAPHPPLNARLPRQLDHNTLLISKPICNPKPAISTPVREINLPINVDHNTISDVLRLMDGLGLPVTPDIYASLVAECTRKRDAFQAAELLAHLKRNRGMVRFLNGSSGLPLLNRMLLTFVVCGSLDVADQMFEEMPQRDSISLAIIIAGLVDNKLFDRALGLFAGMHRWFIHKQCDLALQAVLVCILQASGQLQHVHLGKMVHSRMLKMGCTREMLVATALMEFYGKCRCLPEANYVFFDQIAATGHCDTGIWNVAIVNNCREACFDEVIWFFREMGRVGVKKNDQTFSGVLKACAKVSDGGSYGKQVHANAIKLALDTHISVMCGLVDMYGRCGLLKDARKVFDMIASEERNLACWSAMVTGFIDHGLHIEAIKTLYEMKATTVEPPQSLIDKVMMACGSENLG